MLKVTVEDFQSIDKAELEVSGFTCLTGKSNIGKSALLRALNAAMKNLPANSFIIMSITLIAFLTGLIIYLVGF